MKTIYLLTGELVIPSNPSIIKTVLGSCISVCLWNSRLRCGGINHFKTPLVPANKPSTAEYGEVAMRRLIDGMLNKGSKKSDLHAMVFGGGHVLPPVKGQPDVGRENIEFALSILEEDNISTSNLHTGGKIGRKISFNTKDGSVHVSKVNPVGLS